MPRPLILASSSPGKLREFESFFRDHIPGWRLRLKPAELEVEETGATFAENALLKATTVAKALGEWTLADDSGLSVRALNGAPGIHSARYAPTDAARIERLLREMDGIPNLATRGAEHPREATFHCALALVDPQGQVRALAEGVCQGQILTQPQGRGGFGYDPLFWVPELGLTFAEMSPAQKEELGHRGQALRALKEQLLILGTSLG
ncbi:RdgB/HAM1 family non-canonical purine NTP pyrophosphatase [Synechococcus sp. Nb3U1]|uniref:RdgB/HAM1 family non-canonical purine NTP pyrophosphatase n=1 Tax=Synechococcus sp. Nb3U1 TaxID=1914529 RepID=UPI001F3C0296|nr:RdgB/HAM1 family non-canonical purine NTP pyrophosphatase [Synechococcus sp. Nb3U1]MCF2972012.1 RdgB/HAM1 family non-canonical purine NTP pyrophosphatase [Synechococcus sp. Nb3U1]